MIRRLRQRHRGSFAVLAVVLPLLFLAGLALRPERPAEPVGSPWDPVPVDPGALAAETRVIELEGGSSQLTLGGPVAAADRRGAQLGLRLEGTLAESEILVYASGRPVDWSGDWRDGARLLGVLRAGRPVVAELTSSEASGDGSLRLLDLARDRELPALALAPAAGGGG